LRFRTVIWSFTATLGLLLGVGAAWLLLLPTRPEQSGGPPILADEYEAIVAALRPPKRQRPAIAIIGVNEGTEVTDYLMPYGILRRAEIADVFAVAPSRGPVSLYPALTVMPSATLDEFNSRYPGGADYVIVPAMHRDDDPTALGWIRGQAAKGATIIGICAGAKVVAQAGLLDGRVATTHWYYVDELRKRHPTIRYVPDRRLVVDRGVATTTGITASMPAALTLIEAIAGKAKALEVARDLGLGDWDLGHDSQAFAFTRDFALTAIRNRTVLWAQEELAIEITSGVDEVSLALAADAWSRTFRSRAVTFARAPGPVSSRNGIQILPDGVATNRPPNRVLPSVGDRPPAAALDVTLREIAARYGERTADFVATQLEYVPAGPVGGRDSD
jgi:transcriptional regulator GlxA family with amidase domain